MHGRNHPGGVRPPECHFEPLEEVVESKGSGLLVPATHLRRGKGKEVVANCKCPIIEALNEPLLGCAKSAAGIEEWMIRGLSDPLLLGSLSERVGAELEKSVIDRPATKRSPESRAHPLQAQGSGFPALCTRPA